MSGVRRMEGRGRPGRWSIVAAAAAVVAALVTGCAAAGDPSATSSGGASDAWDPANGTITLGSSERVLELWLDPLCPWCAKFDTENADGIAELVRDGELSFVLHPLMFLDRESQGSQYSTRAATVLIETARADPDAVLPVLAELYERQPGEGTTGLDDAQLASIAERHGVDVRAALTERAYDELLQELTTDAFAGGDAITGTPFVRLDGDTLDPGDGFLADLRARLAL